MFYNKVNKGTQCSKNDRIAIIQLSQIASPNQSIIFSPQILSIDLLCKEDPVKPAIESVKMKTEDAMNGHIHIAITRYCAICDLPVQNMRVNICIWPPHEATFLGSTCSVPSAPGFFILHSSPHSATSSITLCSWEGYVAFRRTRCGCRLLLWLERRDRSQLLSFSNPKKFGVD